MKSLMVKSGIIPANKPKPSPKKKKEAKK